jgi:hypothetical protein
MSDTMAAFPSKFTNMAWSRIATLDAYSPIESLYCSIGLFHSAHRDKPKPSAAIGILVVHNLQETIEHFHFSFPRPKVILEHKARHSSEHSLVY